MDFSKVELGDEDQAFHRDAQAFLAKHVTEDVRRRDRETGETISQLPDETMLKLRIYSRELADRAREAEEQPPAPQVERIA